MKKRFLTAIALMLLCAVALSSCSAPSLTIGDNGNWHIGDEDTGVSAEGQIGITPTVEISDDGYWVINGEKTEYNAVPEDGYSPRINISDTGYWVIDSKVTDKLAIGETGENGKNVNVVSCEKTSTSDDGLVDTYTITFSDGKTTNFSVDQTVTPVITVKETKYSKDVDDSSVFTVQFTDNTTLEIPASKTNEYGFNSNLMTAYSNAAKKGYTGKFSDFALATVKAVIDEYGANAFFTDKELVKFAIPEMLIEWNEYFSTEGEGSSATPVLSENITTSKVNALIINQKSLTASDDDTQMENIIISSALGSSSVTATAKTLAATEYLVLEKNHIKYNKQLTLSFKLSEFVENDTVRFGHGVTEYGSSYVELDKDSIRLYTYYTGANLAKEIKHGLTLKDFVNISVDTGYNTISINIVTSGGTFSTGTIRHDSASNGDIYVMSKKSALTDVKLRWDCPDYANKIWMFGDSYFSIGHNARWPYYLYNDGYIENCMLTGYPGRNTPSALVDFKTALEHGTPQYAVWCMGMNDADSADTINAGYLAATQEFLSICEEKGITPILTTVPSTPTRNNDPKNEWVIASGYRYIDFATAVGGNEYGSPWYPEMLHSDNVHPAALGAYALYAQLITDFPEVMQDN